MMGAPRSWTWDRRSTRSKDSHPASNWRRDSTDRSSFIGLWRRRPDRVARRSRRPLPSIFPVREPDHNDVEDRQPKEPNRKRESHPVELVDDKHDQKGDHPRVGPDLVPEQGRHQHDLDQPMRQQVERAELQGRSRQAVGGVQQMRGQEVVWIFRELVLSQGSAQLVDGRRFDDEQQDATHDLEHAVESLEDDPDGEGSIQQVAALEPVHAPPQYRPLSSGSGQDAAVVSTVTVEAPPLISTWYASAAPS